MTPEEAWIRLRELIDQRQLELQKLIHMGVQLDAVYEIVHTIDEIDTNINDIKDNYGF